MRSFRPPRGGTFGRAVPGATALSAPFEKLPEGPSPGENVGRRVRSRGHRNRRGTGLCAPTLAAIPIAPLQRDAAPQSSPLDYVDVSRLLVDAEEDPLPVAAPGGVVEEVRAVHAEGQLADAARRDRNHAKPAVV